MRRLYSWCGETLENGGTFPLPTTHGVCAPCTRKLLTAIADSSDKDPARRTPKTLEGAGSKDCEEISLLPRSHLLRRWFSGSELGERVMRKFRRFRKTSKLRRVIVRNRFDPFRLSPQLLVLGIVGRNLDRHGGPPFPQNGDFHLGAGFGRFGVDVTHGQ